MRAEQLVVLIWGAEAGVVRSGRNGRVRFLYDDAWRTRSDAVPLSLSMPLAAAEHSHAPVDAFLSGLLPDNEFILERWARRFHVSARNAFALLAHVGEDCAGAVQFVLPERVAAVRGGGPEQVEWIDTDDVAARLRALREDHGAWRVARDTGQFSLAGAQPKTALVCRDGRFGVPSGRTPTTHILKPPMAGLDGHIENEHLCLRLAHALGLPTARSEVRRFGDEAAMVVARYDRVRTEDLAANASPTDARALCMLAGEQSVLRLHQEDLCQALGVRPTAKYQSDGGPTPVQITTLLREHSGRPDADIATFIDALVFNWLIAGTDAHAKNYSILHGAQQRVRLAPLYDLASALPYPGFDPRRMKLAMRIGSKYRLHDVAHRQWGALARELRISEEAVLSRIAELASRVPDVLSELVPQLAAAGVEHPIVPRLAGLLATRAGACLAAIGKGRTPGSGLPG